MHLHIVGGENAEVKDITNINIYIIIVMYIRTYM